MSTFFGQTLESALVSRKNIFTQIHEICFHGKGGYDWNTVYNMPLWLRNFTFSQIQKFHKDESDKFEKEKQKSKGKKTAIGQDGKINPAVFQKPTKSSYK